jgi:glycosyltransferase involved in cell wall biosynthesis
MIVRDEAQRLPRCLDSVRPLARQIVVVDTGSTDGTAEWLDRDRAVDLAHFPWCDDFAAARNASLERASGDWILVLDADEVLEPPGDLDRLLRDPTVEGWYLTVRNLQPAGDLVRYEDSRQLRLFRNRPAYRYRGLVHEQISPALGQRGARVDASDLLITHFGYQAALAQGLPRRARNLRLLRSAPAREPDDWYWHFQLGVTLKPDDPAAAVDHLSRALSLGADHLPAAVREEIHTRLAQLALQADDLELTAQLAHRAVEANAPTWWRGSAWPPLP